MTPTRSPTCLLGAVAALTCSCLLAGSASAAALMEPRAMDALQVVRAVPDRSLAESREVKSLSLAQRDVNGTFDFCWSAQNEILFDGSWQVISGQEFGLEVECIDCRTWGAISTSAYIPEIVDGDVADLNGFDNASLSLVFDGVGAFIELGTTVSAEGTFTIPLFTTITPIGVSGPNFQIGVVFSVDLVLGFTGAVETDGGFQLTIPDGSNFTMPFDATQQNLANFEGASVSLLPLSVEVPANLTAALQLRVEAGVELTAGPFLGATALTGAYINIPELKAGASYAPGDTCESSALAEININVGVFAEFGIDIGVIPLPVFAPEASTTLWSAVATTCLASTTATTSTRPTGTTSCPAESVTETLTMTSSYAVTSCAVNSVNCPSDYTQVITMEQCETTVTSSCPTSTATPSSTCSPTSVPTASTIPLTRLDAPVTSTARVPSTVSTPTPTITAHGGSECSSSPGGPGSTIIELETTTMVSTVCPSGR